MCVKFKSLVSSGKIIIEHGIFNSDTVTYLGILFFCHTLVEYESEVFDNHY
jgi:hypothetical protein